jgi:hypothetical protein
LEKMNQPVSKPWEKRPNLFQASESGGEYSRLPLRPPVFAAAGN